MNLFEQLQKAVRGEPEAPPKDFKTAEQWADEWGVSLTTAQRAIKVGVQKELMVSKVFRVDIGTRLFPVPHYGPKH